MALHSSLCQHRGPKWNERLSICQKFNWAGCTGRGLCSSHHCIHPCSLSLHWLWTPGWKAKHPTFCGPSSSERHVEWAACMTVSDMAGSQLGFSRVASEYKYLLAYKPYKFAARARPIKASFSQFVGNPRRNSVFPGNETAASYLLTAY